MANVKITELTAATALAGTDVLPIVDVGADATKKVSVSDLLRNLPDGTASAPALAFADDQNTGVLSPGDNSLAFATSGTQRLVIDSSGNLGVGTTSPSTLLHLSSTGEPKLRIQDADLTDRYVEISQAGGGTFFRSRADSSNGNFIFSGLGGGTEDEFLRIDNSGRVGIGTSSPGHLLDLSGSSNAYIRQTRGNSAFRVGPAGDQASDGVILGTDTNGPLRIFTNGSSNERLRIDSSGNVGIGTTSVSDRLAVGSSSAEDQRLTIFSSTDGNDDPYGSILFRHSSATGNRNAKISAIRNAGSSGADLTFHTRTHGDATNVDGGEERMRIDSSGNVGIGDSSPSSNLSVKESGTSASSHYLQRLTTASGGFFGIQCGDLSTNTPEWKIITGGNEDLVFGPNNGEKARIDSSGRLLVGTSSAIGGGSVGELLQVGFSGGSRTILANTSSSLSNGALIAQIDFNTNVGGSISTGAAIKANCDGTASAGDAPTRLTFHTSADGASSPTERVRISNNGRFSAFGTSISHVLRVSQTSSSDTAFVVNNNATNTTDGTLKFVVRADGDAENTNNSYGALSDAKLKENIVDAGSQWDDIKNIRVRNYNFIEGETHRQIGVVAQEVETVSPGLVKERKDIDAEGNTLGTTTKAVNYSVLYMKAVKALQEAMNRIETLEAKVAALEAQ